MITFSCLDPDTNESCEISVKDYSYIVFKKLFDEKSEEKDRFYFLLTPEAKWYAVPSSEYENHLYESETEDGACDLEIDLEEGESDGDK